ncbi:MAG TPA: translation elongation factor 4 [Chthonomonadales bacterium]|nr:translation elongation factor 4 [Chthonomonadales bacterium]
MTRRTQDHIRNFCIIAHVDHGKSTLADRILELTGAISSRDMQDQLLDTMDIERERGITIKMTAVRLTYRSESGDQWELNLIDTPGHVDFTYEVSRSLAACEGAVLVVDAAQGVEAQTLANVTLAYNNGLTIVPVINKIDLPAAEPERVRDQIEQVLAIEAHDAVLASAKEGIGTREILEHIVHRVPPPAGDPAGPLRALVFDSHFDQHQGVVCYVRVVDGCVRPGDRVRFMATGKEFEVDTVGVFRPRMETGKELLTGEVGFLTAGIKTIGDANVGDTITLAGHAATMPLPGYRRAKPMVFCGLYPVDSTDYPDLREALLKLQLNDAALSFEPETSAALGFGFRCGFLGLLHMEIIQERLEREFGLVLIATSPSVIYRVHRTDGAAIEIDNPADLPDPTMIDRIEEPYVTATVFVPSTYVGTVMDLARDRRGEFEKMEHPATDRVMLIYRLPLGEILMDFFDQLKSRTRGYASLDYEPAEYQESRLVKLDVLINGEAVDALSFITHRDKAYARGRTLVEKLKEVVPRQQYEVRLQAAIGGKIIAASRVAPFRKNVIAKCYGGDISRKRKLLERQREGKRRMKQIGAVEIPQEAFLSVLKIGES